MIDIILRVSFVERVQIAYSDGGKVDWRFANHLLINKHSVLEKHNDDIYNSIWTIGETGEEAKDPNDFE